MIAGNLDGLSARGSRRCATCVGRGADAGCSSRASTERDGIRVPDIGSLGDSAGPFGREDSSGPRSATRCAGRCHLVGRSGPDIGVAGLGERNSEGGECPTADLGGVVGQSSQQPDSGVPEQTRAAVDGVEYRGHPGAGCPVEVHRGPEKSDECQVDRGPGRSAPPLGRYVDVAVDQRVLRGFGLAPFRQPYWVAGQVRNPTSQG